MSKISYPAASLWHRINGIDGNIIAIGVKQSANIYTGAQAPIAPTLPGFQARIERRLPQEYSWRSKCRVDSRTDHKQYMFNCVFAEPTNFNNYIVYKRFVKSKNYIVSNFIQININIFNIL